MPLPPTLTTPEAYVAVYRDPTYWRPYIDALLHQSNLPPASSLQPPIEGTNVVFIATLEDQRTCVVKLFTPFFNGGRQQGIERLALETFVKHESLNAPMLLASGELYPEEPWPWDYVVTDCLPAPTLQEVWPNLSPQQRRIAARQTGEYLRELHQIPVPPAMRQLFHKRVGPENFAIPWARDVKERALRHGVPAHLADQAPEFVNRWMPESMEVILHGDLNGEHILYDNDRIAAVIDYGDLKLGHPIYDLPALHTQLFNGERPLLAALKEGYGPMPDFSPQAALAFTLIHEWDVLHRLMETNPILRATPTLEELAELVWS